MCGIFGFCGGPSRQIASDRLEACTAKLRHRGPDAGGCIGWTAAGEPWRPGLPPTDDLCLALGHRRLSILDLSAAGNQPMADASGRWLILNGEIYNFLELRSELERAGHSFTTRTDTEVVLAAYGHWGRDCVTRFNGMWSFALYDPRNKGLFCSRDRLGVKPFYYAETPGAFCLASEIAPILQALDWPARIDEAQLARYLVYHAIDDGPATLYQGIRELRGGHSLWVDVNDNTVQVWRYWDLPTEPDLAPTEEGALDRFGELLEDAVRLRLRADVPVAITLSGGIDSSAVTLAAKRIGASAVTAFTSHFPDCPAIDETAYAAEVAAACDARQILVTPDLSHLVEEEPLLTRHQAMPYGSLSLFVHWAIVKAIRTQGVPVVLSGQGGDELFMGYERYLAPYVRHRLPDIPRAALELVRCGRRSRVGVANMLAYLPYFGWPQVRRAWYRFKARRIFSPALLEQLPREPAPPVLPLRALQRHEMLFGQLSQLLRYDDRTAGAHGMETRLPFLDYRLVEFAYRLPWRYKIHAGWTKYLVRRYLERHGLVRVAWRRHKLGFNAPQAAWNRVLWERHGADLLRLSPAQRWMRPKTAVARLGVQEQWDVYNLFQLAYLGAWCPPEGGSESVVADGTEGDGGRRCE